MFKVENQKQGKKYIKYLNMIFVSLGNEKGLRMEAFWFNGWYSFLLIFLETQASIDGKSECEFSIFDIGIIFR
jgi:hypothetical protein